MAEYYPLLAKAIGSLPNSTPDSRRVVYERARKALIGQLRILHPPIPDDDIESESVALDRAIERLESELANGSAPPAPPAATPTPPPPASPPPTPPPAPSEAVPPAAPKVKRPSPPPKPPVAPKPPPAAAPPPAVIPATDARPASPASADESGVRASTDTRPPPPLRPKPLKPPVPKPPAPKPPAAEVPATVPALPMAPGAAPADASPAAATVPAVVDGEPPPAAGDPGKRAKPPRADPQRPFAPQPPVAQGPKRRLWIIPVALVVVMGAVGFAAWKLRDHPETIVQGKPAEPVQADSGKIAERIGQPPSSRPANAPTAPSGPQAPAAAPTETPGSAPNAQSQPQQTAPAAPANPELPVAHRAALLVEAPSEPNKIKTFLGTVVWKLNNAPQGPNDAVGLEVEADIDLPDDKMKAVVTFAKNTEASLPASHTINIRYTVDSGSYTGDVKQISVPQMRPEASPSGEPLAGVTVQIVPNSFLVGLSPGNEEAANTDLMRRLQWIDIPMLLDNGKIAKLTFEKSESGQRDLNEALDAWSKQ